MARRNTRIISTRTNAMHVVVCTPMDQSVRFISRRVTTSQSWAASFHSFVRSSPPSPPFPTCMGATLISVASSACHTTPLSAGRRLLYTDLRVSQAPPGLSGHQTDRPTAAPRTLPAQVAHACASHRCLALRRLSRCGGPREGRVVLWKGQSSRRLRRVRARFRQALKGQRTGKGSAILGLHTQ